eukprot:424311-Amphidinium_carterae.2
MQYPSDSIETREPDARSALGHTLRCVLRARMGMCLPFDVNVTVVTLYAVSRNVHALKHERTNVQESQCKIGKEKTLE